jgi:hypothetical protein
MFVAVSAWRIMPMSLWPSMTGSRRECLELARARARTEGHEAIVVSLDLDDFALTMTPMVPKPATRCSSRSPMR